MPNQQVKTLDGVMEELNRLTKSGFSNDTRLLKLINNLHFIITKEVEKANK